MSDVSAVVEKNEAKLGLGRQVVDDELLGGRPQQVPNIVAVHGLRVLEDEDVTRRLLPAHDELRRYFRLCSRRGGHLGPELHVWVHSDDLQGRLPETEGVLLRSRARDTVKFGRKDAESILEPPITYFVTALETPRSLFGRRAVSLVLRRRLPRLVMARPDERCRDVDEVARLATTQTLLSPRSPFVDGVIVADVEVSRL